jgi:hypothetical protein
MQLNQHHLPQQQQWPMQQQASILAPHPSLAPLSQHHYQQQQQPFSHAHAPPSKHVFGAGLAELRGGINPQQVRGA